MWQKSSKNIFKYADNTPNCGFMVAAAVLLACYMVPLMMINIANIHFLLTFVLCELRVDFLSLKKEGDSYCFFVVFNFLNYFIFLQEF